MKTESLKINLDENEFKKFFTSKRISLIKSENAKALKTVFERYYDFFYLSANKYWWRFERETISDPSEFLSQLYLDLPYLNYDSYDEFIMSMYKRSFGYCKNGGYRYLYENCSYIFFTLEKNALSPWVKGRYNEIEIFDLMCSPYGIGYDKKEAQYNKKVRVISRFISSFLTEKQLKYFILQLEGYSPSQIAEKRNLSLQAGNSMKNKIKKVLFSHYQEIESFLKNKLNFDVSYRIAAT